MMPGNPLDCILAAEIWTHHTMASSTQVTLFLLLRVKEEKFSGRQVIRIKHNIQCVKREPGQANHNQGLQRYIAVAKAETSTFQLL